jgi:glyoxylase-like metal-dependent hydrolase (beta-lactamase superfamily II)
MFLRAILAVITAVLIIATSYVSGGIATDETTKAQVPGIYSFRLGKFTIAALSDGTIPQDLDKVLTNANSSEVEQFLYSNFLTNPVEASINAFPIDTKDKQVLVDTGTGQLFGPGLGGKLQLSLKAAGYAPDEIDAILLTHIHTDHSGGLVENGRLMFPAATLRLKLPATGFRNSWNVWRSKRKPTKYPTRNNEQE